MIYSPSETKAWLENPVGRYLHYVEGWTPKLLGKKELSGFLGTAYAAGMEEWHKGSGLEFIIGKGILGQQVTDATEQGHVINPKEEPFYNNLYDHLEKLLTKSIKHWPIPQDWKIVGSEVKFKETRCRMDLVVETPEGITFVDYKTKSTLDGYYYDRTVAEWQYDWQFMHYAWTLLQHSSKPLASSFHVMLVTYGNAKKPELLSYPIDMELVATWFEAAKVAWARMEEEAAGNVVPVWNWCLSNRYGADPWAEAMVTARLEPHLMERNFIRKVKTHENKMAN